MWVQKDSFPKKITWNEVLDWVVINGVIWVEIQEEKRAAAYVQPGVERNNGKDAVQAEMQPGQADDCSG